MESFRKNLILSNCYYIEERLQLTSDEFRIVHSETPVKEIWSRLSYFENEHNVREFLKKKNDTLTEVELADTSKSFAYMMQTAREYYKSASLVSLLTKPLLLFYGMTAFSKVLFIATYLKNSPSKGHGLKTPNQKDFAEDFSKISTRVQIDGTFPQFHCCYSKESLRNVRFNLKELLSIISEAKVEYETVYNEKSQAIKTSSGKYGLVLIDTELGKYGNLRDRLQQYFPKTTFMEFGGSILIQNTEDLQLVRSLSGEEYVMLPLEKGGKFVFLPELSAHFLIMYLLGMVSRYYLKEWGEIISGKTSGEIYVVQKFLEVTTRKFPNLILNKLHGREFVFVSPQLEQEKQLDNDELERIREYIHRQDSFELRGLGI